jgi:two-component system LytT family response regulator
MRTLIVDDNKIARLALKNLVGQVDYLQFAGECASGLEAVNFLNREKVDLMLLDVEMPEMTGIELIRQLNNCPLVILTTSKRDYAVEAFEQRVVDYIVKPVLLPRFLKSIERVKEIFESSAIVSKSEDYFFVRNEGSWTKIIYNEILFIQALGDYAIINTTAGKYTVHITMKTLEEKLSPDKFQRVHRSYIVAISKIATVTDNMIYIDGKPIPVADSYKVQLTDKLNFF